MSEPDLLEFIPETEPHEHAWDPTNGHPRGRCFAFAGSDMLVLGTLGATSEVPSWDDLRAWNISAIRYQYLGTLGGEPCWSAELPPGVQLPEGGASAGCARCTLSSQSRITRSPGERPRSSPGTATINTADDA